MTLGRSVPLCVMCALVPILTSMIGTARPEAPEKDQLFTFNRDIAPIIFQHCAPCHRLGQSGPFSLTSYMEVRKRAGQIATVTASRFMPPWKPQPGYGEFRDERRLSETQISMIRCWVDQGALEGSSPRPSPPKWTEGWQLGKPDLVVKMAQPYRLAAEGLDVFRNFVIPIPMETERYVEAIELRPGNPKLVHHAVMQIARTEACRILDEQDPEPGFDGMEMGESEAPDGHILSWTPGKMPHKGTRGLSWRLGKNNYLVIQLHMLPSGKPEWIQPSVGFYFAGAPPARKSLVVVLRNDRIDIAPGKRDYQIKDSFVLPVDVEVLSLYPHAHYLGKDMKIYAELPNGTRKWLLWIPDWDFNWQDQYWFREPETLPAGSKIVMNYTYDNSAENTRNPSDPPRRVVQGKNSTDEMGTLAIQMVLCHEADYALLREAQLRDIIKTPSNPKTWLAHNALGKLLDARGLFDEAIGQYRQALRIKPDYFRAHFNLGAARQSQGRLKQAVRHYLEALKLKPDSPQAHNNLAMVLSSQGKSREALHHFRLALELDPGNARLHNNLGNALGSRLEEAIVHYRQALEIKPDYAEAHNNLGIALASQRKLEQAMKHFRRALEINPNYAEARGNLETLLKFTAVKP